MRLLADGEAIVDVPPKLSARTQVFATGQGRKTATDAHSVALVGTQMAGLRPVVNDEQQTLLRSLPKDLSPHVVADGRRFERWFRWLRGLMTRAKIERMVEVTGPRVPDTQRASVIAGRLLALGLSLMWGVFGFGLIDLETALPPGHPGFREHWFLEGSWGFFVTALVIVPLLVVVLEPARAYATIGQLHVVAACCAAAAVLCLDGKLLALPIALEVTAWAVWGSLRGLAKRVAQGAPIGRETRLWWPLALVVGTYGALPLLFGSDAYTVKVLGILAGVLGLATWLAYAPTRLVEDGAPRVRSWPIWTGVLVSAGAWTWYAVSMAAAFWDGTRYAGAVDRISAQSGFALAVGLLPVVATLGCLPIRLPVWTASAAGAGLGSVAILYPNQLASPGAAWGLAAIIWFVVSVAVAETALRRRSARPTRAQLPARAHRGHRGRR